MDVPKATAYAVVLLTCFGWALQVSAQVFKCIDPATGKTSFSDQGCPTSNDVSTINIRPANSIDGSQYRQQATEPEQYRTAVNPAQRGVRVTVVGGDRDAEREHHKLCKQASTPYSGARGLTANQLATAAQLCAGVSVSHPEERQGTSGNAPVAPGSPSVITSCDLGGCWDSNGGRYIKGAGDTYIPASGGAACQRIDGFFNCP